MTSPARDLPHPGTHDAPTVERLLAERGWLRALARSLVVDAATADDVAQDATILALTRPPRAPAAIRGWLRRVVGNLASNVRRAEGRRGARETAAARPEASHDDPADVVVRWELRRAVVDAVLALDEPYRTTVLLRFFEGLEPDAIAARLGVPRDTVRTRQRRALEMLRARLVHLDDRAGRRGLAVLLVLAGPDGGGTGPAAPGAASGAASSAGAATKGLVLGGFAMSAVTKTLVATAVVAVVAAGWWALRTRDVRDGGAVAAPADAPVAARPGRAKRPEAAPAVADAATQASLASADRERDLHGIVLSPGDSPVAGAKVEVLRMKPWSSFLAQESGWSPYDVKESASSREDGTFAIRLVPGDDVALRVDAAGFAVWESVWRQAGERVTVRLAPALTLDVTVLDAARSPVAGAMVRVVGEEGGGRLGSHAATDAAGRVSFGRLPRGASVNVLVQPRAAPDAIRPAKLADAETDAIEVVLPQGVAVSGAVVDATTGNRIAGARVARRDTFLGAVTTGPDGRFTLDGLERGHAAVLHADAPGHARGSCTAMVLAGESSGPDVEIVLQPAARVTGRVVTIDGGPTPLAVAGADVVALAAWQTDGGRDRSLGGAPSGPDGRFEVPGLSPGRAHALRVRATGRGGVVRTAQTPTSPPYTIDVGDVVLPVARTLRGMVLDGEDRPVARAAVLLVGPRYDGDPDVTREHRRTDDLGRFTFGDLGPGAYEVEASVGTLRTRAQVEVAVDIDPPPATLVLAAEGRRAAKFPVRVRVVDEDGTPVAGVSVQAGYVANGASATVTTDAAGVTVAPGEFPAPYLFVSFHDEALALRYERPDALRLRPGAADAEIVLRRIGGAAGAETLTGRVVDEAGAPVARATIGVIGDLRGLRHASADADGRFAIAVPSGSPVDLVAKPQPDRRAPLRVGELLGARAGDLVAIVVRRVTHDRALDVTVVGPDGAPLAGALVNVTGDGIDWREPRMAPTDARGAAVFTALPACPLTAEVTVQDPAGRVNVSRTLRTAQVSSTQRTVRIVVPAARTVRGRVVSPDGAPCGGAFVHMASPASSCQTIAEADGSFALDVNADEAMPFAVYANPLSPEQAKKPLAGWDLVESFDRELEIRLAPVPTR